MNTDRDDGGMCCCSTSDDWLDRDVSNLRSLLATYECEGPEPVARHQIAAHFRFADALGFQDWSRR